MKQHVATPTHSWGHTLDLIITRSEDDLVDGIVVRDPTLSDHFAVHCTLKLTKPRAEQHQIRYRQLSSIDMNALRKDLKDSTVLQETITDLPTLVDKYETELTRVLDIHAPEKKRMITVRPAAAWYNDDIDREKRKRRKLERRWRKSRLVIDRELYKEQCKVASSLIKKANENYYSNIIQENKGNQKILFNTISRLLHRKTEECYPTAPSSEVLANRFADFFCQEIGAIKNDLFTRYTPVANPLGDAQACSAKLTEFEYMTEDQVKSLANSSCLKTCSLDPLPASIMKDCMDALLPVLTMINISIETATVPVQLKETMIRPKLKKESLNYEVYYNFRPLSKLKYISKMTERTISYQLTNYFRDNDLEESLQSAYETYHSTETALVKVHNDIVSAIDNQSYVILLLLDLSAAFDTVDHKILLQRLSCRFGIDGKALCRFKSYLENRKQVVNVKGATSCSKDLRCGVPQGSVLGPILYVLYTSTLSDIVRSHGLSCHFYADDTQLYCSFKLHDQVASAQVIESCSNDIDA